MKRSILLLTLPLLLASCGNEGGQSNEKKVTFYQNIDPSDMTVLYTQTKAEDGSVSKPAVPLYKRYVFDGWYDEKEGGNKYDFASEAPESLFAHWVIYEDLSAHEKVSRYVSRIAELSGLVSETRGHVESSLQYATAEGTFYTVDNFCATRYDDLARIDHYFPKVCYSEADMTKEELEAGYTVESLNKKNLIFTEQDCYDNDSFVAIYDYNELHPEHAAADKDGKASSKMSEEAAYQAMDISFASYFMGWANQLAMFLKLGESMYVENASPEEDFGPYSYWIKGMNVSTLDETSSSGAFAFMYTYSVTSQEGYTATYLYSSTAEFAIVNGKIRHCQVQKENDYFLEGDCLMVERSISVFDFDQVEELPEYNGERLDPIHYDEFEY